MSLINDILDVLNRKNKKQSDLCAYLGINTSTMTNWKNRSTDPPSKYIIPICEFLDVTPYFLLTGKEKKMSIPDDELELLTYYKELPEREQMKLIGRASALAEVYKEQIEEPKPPILSIYCSQNRVSAGVGEELFDYEQWDTVDVIETPVSRKADFMLIVDGESMSPKFHDGDYVLIRQQPAVEQGQIGIFYIDGKGYIKKYDGDYLISLNPDYDDIYIVDKEPRCFGLVLGIAELA